jgi:adenylate cyclase
MGYRRQLLICLIFLVLVATGLFAAACYHTCDALLRHEVHRKVHSIASTAALMIDPATLAAITARGDEAKPQYAQIAQVLRKVRDANRRPDAWVDQIYTLRPAPEDPRVLEYGVDTEESLEKEHHVGDVYRIGGVPLTIGLAGLHALDNQLDHFIAGYDTGFAPIYDHSGRLIGELGVKLGWAPASQLGNVWQYLLPPFAATLTLAILLGVLLARMITRPLDGLLATIEAIGRGNLNITAKASGPAEFVTMASALNTMTAGLRERQTIKQAFAGYVSQPVMDLIVRDGKVPELTGERRRITVLFADIRNFTSLAELMRPEETVEILAEFYERMIEAVGRNHGVINKFLGDGLMVIFGAPLDDPYQEEHAITAAIEMQQELRTLCEQWQSNGRHGFKMGIGINSGNAIVGNIGTRERMEYTALGDTVNVASRLQGATKETGAEVLVSEPTYDAVRGIFEWKPLGEIQVRGRAGHICIYAVEGKSTQQSPDA